MLAEKSSAASTRAEAGERTVIQAEALEWLRTHAAAPASSVITSLPDLSELPELGFENWKAWFANAARQILSYIPDDGVAMFYQSDVRHAGIWIDKGYLVLRAAEELGSSLVFHKIVCRKPPGTISHGRASYSHLLCFSKNARASPSAPGPDVLADAGFMPFSKAMGVEACRLACRFLIQETATELVVDPFCGHGTVLAVANSMGLRALGIDISIRKCRAARKLRWPSAEANVQSSGDAR